MPASRYRDISHAIRADWRFYRRRTQWLGKVILIETFIVMLCMVGITYVAWDQVIGSQDKMKVYGTDTRGYLYGTNPLKQQLRSSTEVQKYINPRLLSLLTMAPDNYQQVIANNKRGMTTEAQADYDDALAQIQLEERWMKGGFAFRAEAAGKMQITDSAVEGDWYTWYVRQPIQLNIIDTQNPNQDSGNFPLALLVQVSQFRGGKLGIRGLSLEGN
ncbi:MAG: hypothetical protein Alpg2KO_24820 [Alphaproteobacteria bacterium]